MLQVDVDASEKDRLIRRYRFLVQDVRQVGGEHDDVVPRVHQAASEGVVPHADTAMIIARAGCDEGNFHEEPFANPYSMGTGSSANSEIAVKSSVKSLSSTLPIRQSVKSPRNRMSFIISFLKLKSSS